MGRFAVSRLVRWTAPAAVVLIAAAGSFSPSSAGRSRTKPAPGPAPTASPTASPTPAPSPAGRTYYVDAVAGNDAASGLSEAMAWRTAGRAGSAEVTPGDSVLFKRGQTFSGEMTISSSGSASARVTFGTYGTGTAPVITGGSSCVVVSGSFVALRGFRLENCSWAGVDLAGGGNLIEENVISNNVAGVAVRPTSADNSIVRNQLLSNNKMSRLTAGSADDDSGAFGILINGDRNEVAFNTISGSDAFSYDYGRDGSAVEIYGGRDNHVHHNRAADNDTFAELGDARASGNVFAYNVVTSVLADSIFLVTRGSASSFGPVTGTTAANNTVVLSGSRSQGFVCHAGCDATILKMRNNVIEAVWKAGYADGAFDEENNVFWGGQAQFQMSSSAVFADPLFSDRTKGDFRLAFSSPGVDRGSDAGYAVDFNGLPVPIDGNRDGVKAPDSGAYEFGV
ncbi:MAG: right-handed parallel beta-helix repeat-containing protein [Actinomycetota bacterium]